MSGRSEISAYGWKCQLTNSLKLLFHWKRDESYKVQRSAEVFGKWSTDQEKSDLKFILVSWFFAFVFNIKHSFFKLINLFLAVLGLRFLCQGFLQLWQAGATLHRCARASHCRGLSCCGAHAPDAQAQQLWLTGLVVLWHVGSSQTRA